MSSTQNALNNTLASAVLTGTLPGAQFPALTGDVTTTAGSLATSLASNSVVTAKINAAAVTYAKIQNVAANSLLGNPTGSGAAVSEITLGAGLSFSGTTLVASATFSPPTTSVVTGTSQAMLVNTNYVSNNASLCTLTLPATAAVGSQITVGGLGAGGWQVAQNSAQLVHFGSSVTTTGVGGSIGSNNQYDSITLLCVVANTTWIVTASQGNMTVT